jgi:L-rhamnose isomerase/sugar isomerase
VRPLVAESYRQSGGALNPVAAYRAGQVRESLIQQRGKLSLSTGL